MLAYARSDGQFLQDSLLQIFSSRFSSLPIPHGCDSGSKARWKVIRSRSSVADIGQVFNNVLQFADIAGPAVLMEYRQDFFYPIAHLRSAHVQEEGFEKGSYQHRDVFFPFGKWW